MDYIKRVWIRIKTKTYILINIQLAINISEVWVKFGKNDMYRFLYTNNMQVKYNGGHAGQVVDCGNKVIMILAAVQYF